MPAPKDPQKCKEWKENISKRESKNEKTNQN